MTPAPLAATVVIAATGVDLARLAAWARPRARIVLSAALVGGALGALATLGLALASPLPAASARAFALGALAFGFGLLGWSGSVMLGRSVERLQRTLDVGTDWTEADSRRAMVRIAAAGAGAMLAVASATTALGALGALLALA
ncbi:hypothetical protein ACFQPA_11280 [Halomarina halobia]|uniref:Uncharacterized protein n=1 Tax=Halomarina halobia TaxID=3033386 RepID=A0ABD6A9Q1_9EURY|nr:hypothetical protein [Halomarina sp. PSR21]